MRRLSARLVAALDLSDSEDDVIPGIRRAVEQVRGRPVRMHPVAFPPEIASGLWIDRTTHDVIAYERQTDLEHQLVIIGHEVWHMFEGHCGSLTAHGPAASRAAEERVLGGVRHVVAAICEADPAELPLADQMDLGLHVALRADDPSAVRHEEEAEYFGYRFATGVREAMAEARSLADPELLAGRIQVSMVHRIRGT
jgi:hypothetical protein